MFAVVEQYGNGLYGVVDTRDNVLEQYTAEQLFYISDKVKIRGVDKKNRSIRCLPVEELFKVYSAQGKLSGDGLFEWEAEGRPKPILRRVKVPSNPISSITIPYGVGVIQNHTFLHWSKSQFVLDTIIVPSTVEIVVDEAFYGVPVREIVFKDSGCKLIMDTAFRDSGITRFIAPSGLEQIQHLAFMGCSNLSFASFAKTKMTLKDFKQSSLQGVKRTYFPVSCFEDSNGKFLYTFDRNVLIEHLNRIYEVSNYFERFYDFGMILKKTDKGYLLDMSKEF